MPTVPASIPAGVRRGARQMETPVRARRRHTTWTCRTCHQSVDGPPAQAFENLEIVHLALRSEIRSGTSRLRMDTQASYTRNTPSNNGIHPLNEVIDPGSRGPNTSGQTLNNCRPISPRCRRYSAGL